MSIKNQSNIFITADDLKAWAIDLSEACGSKIINKKPNVSKIDALIDKLDNFPPKQIIFGFIV